MNRDAIIVEHDQQTDTGSTVLNEKDTSFYQRKAKASGRFELDMRRMVSDFGGITAMERMLKASGNDISEGAVDVWRRRRACNVTSLLHIAMAAQMTQQIMPSTRRKWNLLDYIIVKQEEANDEAEAETAHGL
jgi:hypothetical protein